MAWLNKKMMQRKAEAATVADHPLLKEADIAVDVKTAYLQTSFPSFRLWLLSMMQPTLPDFQKSLILQSKEQITKKDGLPHFCGRRLLIF